MQHQEPWRTDEQTRRAAVKVGALVLLAVTAVGVQQVAARPGAATDPSERPIALRRADSEAAPREFKSRWSAHPFIATRAAEDTAEVSLPAEEWAAQEALRPSWDEIVRERSLATSEPQLAEQFLDWVDDAEEDPTGTLHLRVAQGIELCRAAPGSEQRAERLRRLSQARRPGADAEAQAAAETAKLQQDADFCSQVENRIADESLHHHIENAALKGSTLAQVKLATALLPPEADMWSEDELRRHRHNMAGLLRQARSACEPLAFEAFAEAKGLGTHWEAASTDPPLDIERYGNRLALGLYQAAQTRGAITSGTLEENLGQLRSLIWSSGMSEDDVKRAEKYGRELYAQHCTD